MSNRRNMLLNEIIKLKERIRSARDKEAVRKYTGLLKRACKAIEYIDHPDLDYDESAHLNSNKYGEINRDLH